MSTTKEDLDYEPFAHLESKKALTQTLEDAVRDTMVHTSTETVPSSGDQKDLSELGERYSSHTYEDILATAVLNKVFEKCQVSHHEFGSEAVTEHAGTDTDSGLSGSLRGDVLKGIFRCTSGGASEDSLSPPCHSPKDDSGVNIPSKISGSPLTSLGTPEENIFPDDDLIPDIEFCPKADPTEEEHCMRERHSNRTSPSLWNPEDDEGPPVEFKIEEHIEEITTHHITDEEWNEAEEDDEEEAGATPSGTDSHHSDTGFAGKQKSTYRKKRFASKVLSGAPHTLLPAFDLPSINGTDISGSKRVPFPELGMDLLHESSDTIDGGPSELVLENVDWKENWLFRAEKYKKNRGVKSGDPITMLIPNPSSVVGPTIGDRDIDELSELSDRHSICSFDAFTSEEEGDEGTYSKNSSLPVMELHELTGEISAEFGQQDHEYTEDTAILHRLQMSKRQSVGNSGGHDKDTTYVSRKNITNGKAPKRIGAEKFGQHRRATVILKPPEIIPGISENVQSSSSTIWFEVLPEDQRVPMGRVVRIVCQVQARKECDVNWYFNSELVDGRKDVLSWRKGDHYYLNVFEMSEAKEGTYLVAAHTQEDCAWARFQVVCAESVRVNKMPRITLTLSDVTVEEGSDVILECQVGGHPEPRVTFLRNSVPLNPSTDYSFIENDPYGTWILQLRDVAIHEGGRFKAIASNCLGHAMTSCNVTVAPEGQMINAKDKPEASKVLKKKKKSSSAVESNSSSEKKQTSKLFKSREINNKDISFEPQVINASTDDQTLTWRNNNINNNNNEIYDSQIDNYNSQDVTINGRLFQPPKPGTIAEREHRKWLEAKPLPNNPYSPEKLAHRLGHRPSAFPSLPPVYHRETPEEDFDARLREGLMSSSTDLSRYSRDYHINNMQEKSGRGYKSEDDVKSQPKPKPGLVRIEITASSDWKDELRDIKLNVGKKVADIQKTIDAVQQEWGLRHYPRAGNKQHVRNNTKFTNQKLSSSCINLTSPPKNKSFAYSPNSRYLVYSSTEALNNKPHTEKGPGDLWRTVSVDILNSPPKFSLMSSGNLNDQIGRARTFDSRESFDCQREQQGFIARPISDSDDSTGHNATYYTRSGYKSLQNPYTNQNGYRKMSSYYSENSVDSVKEESDTEESLSNVEDNPNLPSVKELASKFDSIKNARNRSSSGRKTHEKPLRSSRNKDVVIVERRDQNGSIIHSYRSAPHSRKCNTKFSVNEVRTMNSATSLGSLSNNNFLGSPFRYEDSKWRKSNVSSLLGYRTSRMASDSSDVFSPNDDESFHNSSTAYFHGRNRFSTSEVSKADEFWGASDFYKLQRTKQLSSSLSSVADSDISVITSSLIPDSTSKNISNVFGVKLRSISSGNIKSYDAKFRSSSSDIFPLGKSTRPKSVLDFRNILKISNDESVSGGHCDPVIARTRSLPKFHASITHRPQATEDKIIISKGLTSVQTFTPGKDTHLQNDRLLDRQGTCSFDRKLGGRMYDFLKRYENKKSLDEIQHCYKANNQYQNKPKAQIKSVQGVSNQNEPLNPKLTSKSPTSMYNFLQKYSNNSSNAIRESENANNNFITNQNTAKERRFISRSADDLLASVEADKETKFKALKKNYIGNSVTHMNSLDSIQPCEHNSKILTLFPDNLVTPKHKENDVFSSDVSAYTVSRSVQNTEKSKQNDSQSIAPRSKENSEITAKPGPKPEITPKPIHITKHFATISKHQFLKSRTSQTLPKQKTFVNTSTKFKTVQTIQAEPNKLYHQYLHNYSNIRSLAEKKNATYDSNQLKSDVTEVTSNHNEYENVLTITDSKQGSPSKNTNENGLHLLEEGKTLFEYEPKHDLDVELAGNFSVNVTNDNQIYISNKVKDELQEHNFETESHIIKDDTTNLNVNTNSNRQEQSLVCSEQKEKEIYSQQSCDENAADKNYDETLAKEPITNQSQLDGNSSPEEIKKNINSDSFSEETQSEFGLNELTTCRNETKTNVLVNSASIQNENDHHVTTGNLYLNSDKISSKMSENAFKKEQPDACANSSYKADDTPNLNGFTQNKIRDNPMEVLGPYAAVLNRARNPEQIESSNTIDDDDDPMSLTKRIIKGARYGRSGLGSPPMKVAISKASIPQNSPFSYKTKF